jgi:hypothetical protein
MEVSAKGGGWEGGQQEDERGRWVGRKKGVGASKKTRGQGWAKLFLIKTQFPEKKNTDQLH